MDRFDFTMPGENETPMPICTICGEWDWECTCNIEIDKEDD